MKKLIFVLLSIFIFCQVVIAQNDKPTPASRIRFKQLASQPENPPDGYHDVYVTEGGSVIVIHSNGEIGFLGLGAGNGLYINEFGEIGLVSDPSVNSLLIGTDPNIVKLSYYGFGVGLRVRGIDDGPAMLDVQDITLGGRLTRNGTTALLGDGLGLEKDSYLAWSRLGAFPWLSVSQGAGEDDGLDVGLQRVSRDNLKVVDHTLAGLGNLQTGDLTIGAGTPITKVLSGSDTLDFDLSAAASQDLTITVTGASVGDTVSLGVPNASVTPDTIYSAWVSGADTVTVRALRISGTPDPDSGSFRVTVVKF